MSDQVKPNYQVVFSPTSQPTEAVRGEQCVDDNVFLPSECGPTTPERVTWAGRLDFLMSCLGYAVGLGNVWRFPYLCYRNGGGAFLIPYVIMLTFAGLPLYFMELSFGQYASQGPISIWEISPLFQGIGLAMVLVSALVSIYYNMILAWTLFYLVSSLQSSLPWEGCDNWWNTDFCSKLRNAEECHQNHNGSLQTNGSCLMTDGSMEHGFRRKFNISKEGLRSASDEYFHTYMLGITDGLHNLGEIRWQLTLCLFIAWCIVFACLVRGVRSSGKIVYFTAMFPYAVLIILLLRGATLPGSSKGIAFYVTPDFARLLEPQVWGDAAIQIFFSLSPCWGGLITLASYNPFNNNCYKDSIIICVCNCATSVFAGFVIFSIIGFMSETLRVPVDQVASQGAGLAFIAYPEAMTMLPVPPMWSVLFFTMLLTLGLGSQFAIVETVTTAIVDTFPNALRAHKGLVVFACCCFFFLCGLPCCSRGGMYVLQLMDNYCSSWSILVIGICECTVISWIYGVENFLSNIESMIGMRPGAFWCICWKFLTPIILAGIFVFNVVMYKPISYGIYVFPVWANLVGWLLSFLSMSMIPLVAFYKIYWESGSFIQRVKKLSAPTRHWGPALQLDRQSSVASALSQGRVVTFPLFPSPDGTPLAEHVEMMPVDKSCFIDDAGDASTFCATADGDGPTNSVSHMPSQ